MSLLGSLEKSPWDVCSVGDPDKAGASTHQSSVSAVASTSVDCYVEKKNNQL